MPEINEENKDLIQILNYYKNIAFIEGYNANDGSICSHFQGSYSLYPILSLLNKKNMSDLAKTFLDSEKEWNNSTLHNNITNKRIKASLLETKNELNESQKKAIKKALSHKLSIISGPPGTGKTETILNLVSCIIANNKKIRVNGTIKKVPMTVAVVSNNKNALNNITEKIEEFKKIKENGYSNIKKLCDSYAALGNKKIRADWKNNKYHFEELGKSLTIGNLSEFNDQIKIDERNYPLNCALLLTSENLKSTCEVCKQNKCLYYGIEGYGDLRKLETAGMTKILDNNNEEVKYQKFLNDLPFITTTIHSLPKLFSDINLFSDENYNDKNILFDYIIIDEASQTDVIKGLLAMSFTENLVLVGDDKQLAPIPFVRKNNESNRNKLLVCQLDNQNLKDIYCIDANINEGNSILRAVQNRYDKNIVPNTLLNEHYRCHPGIIDFCNEEFYNNLKIKTKTDKFYTRNIDIPIKVLWYKGVYNEKRHLEENKKISLCNMKQIEIMKEDGEFDYIDSKIKDESICILAPFKAQLEAIKKALKDYPNFNDKYIHIENVNGDNEVEETEKKYFDQITIHKSQGHEFDIVYLLPVEDSLTRWPWNQPDRLLNVAVSRAKKELRIICSSEMFSNKLKRNLQLSTDNNSTSSDNNSFQNLLEYAWYKKNNNNKDIFWFHKSNLKSIFDKLPEERQEQDNNKIEDISSAPESIVKEKLDEIIRNFNKENNIGIQKNVTLAQILHENDKDKNLGSNNYLDQINYIKSDSHFDFIIYDNDKKTKNIILIIEVDGEHHRWKEIVSKRDKLKNEICKDKKFFHGIVIDSYNSNSWYKIQKEESYLEDIIDDNAFVLLRLNTSGNSWEETEVIKKLIEKNIKFNKDKNMKLTKTVETEKISYRKEHFLTNWILNFCNDFSKKSEIEESLHTLFYVNKADINHEIKNLYKVFEWLKNKQNKIFNKDTCPCIYGNEYWPKKNTEEQLSKITKINGSPVTEYMQNIINNLFN